MPYRQNWGYRQNTYCTFLCYQPTKVGWEHLWREILSSLYADYLVSKHLAGEVKDNNWIYKEKELEANRSYGNQNCSIQSYSHRSYDNQTGTEAIATNVAVTKASWSNIFFQRAVDRKSCCTVLTISIIFVGEMWFSFVFSQWWSVWWWKK